jgi:hypothetical protein
MEFERNITEKLMDYYETCIRNYKAHIQIANAFNNLYIYTTLPIIIIGSTTTVLASYNSSVTDPHFAVTVAVLSGITTIGNALVAFFEYHKKKEIHTITSTKYRELSYDITQELLFPYYNLDAVADESAKKEYIRNVFDKVHKMLKSIQENEPYISIPIDGSIDSVSSTLPFTSKSKLQLPVPSDPIDIPSLYPPVPLKSPQRSSAASDQSRHPTLPLGSE